MEKSSNNNQAFSLVELIVVIAIMAVLVGILAPILVRHIDKSKRSTDIQNVQEYLSAIRMYATDHEDLKTGSITLTKEKAAEVQPSDSKIIEAFGTHGFQLAAMTLTSNSWGTSVVITVTVDKKGQPTFTVQQNGTPKVPGDEAYDLAAQLGLSH